jgi:hypothetical protein
MCLTIKSCETVESLTVYKVFEQREDGLYSPFIGTKYELNPFIVDKFGKRGNTIEEGIHSILELETAKRWALACNVLYGSIVLIKCIVRGQIYHGKDGDISSLNIELTNDRFDFSNPELEAKMRAIDGIDFKPIQSIVQ